LGEIIIISLKAYPVL